jgi:predicted enzyme related to lactoylglutathione lyase
MGERTSHAPGSFSWVDLGTTDTAAAKDFYSSLFGWEAEDSPMPDGGAYTMLRARGKHVGALYEARPGQPVAWASYVTVESADAAAAAAKEHGGTLMAEPFDVMEAGRMALVQDPTGAVFAAWEPRDNIGAQLVNEPGALTLNQLNTADPERAREFYSALFGWRFEAVEGVDSPYWGIYNGERVNAGMMPVPAEVAPAHWLAYFGCEDVDAEAQRVEGLGGSLMVPPMSVPGGRIAVAQDPQGGAFGLFAGRFDD